MHLFRPHEKGKAGRTVLFSNLFRVFIIACAIACMLMLGLWVYGRWLSTAHETTMFTDYWWQGIRVKHILGLGIGNDSTIFGLPHHKGLARFGFSIEAGLSGLYLFVPMRFNGHSDTFLVFHPWFPWWVLAGIPVLVIAMLVTERIWMNGKTGQVQLRTEKRDRSNYEGTNKQNRVDDP